MSPDKYRWIIWLYVAYREAEIDIEIYCWREKNHFSQSAAGSSLWSELELSFAALWWRAWNLLCHACLHQMTKTLILWSDTFFSSVTCVVPSTNGAQKVYPCAWDSSVQIFWLLLLFQAGSPLWKLTPLVFWWLDIVTLECRPLRRLTVILPNATCAVTITVSLVTYCMFLLQKSAFIFSVQLQTFKRVKCRCLELIETQACWSGSLCIIIGTHSLVATILNLFSKS